MTVPQSYKDSKTVSKKEGKSLDTTEFKTDSSFTSTSSSSTEHEDEMADKMLPN